MMKKEFEQLVYSVLPADQYKLVEEVYMECELFQTKQEIARFYIAYGMDGIKKIHERIVLEQRKLHKEIADLRSKVAEYEMKAQQDEFISRLQELVRMANPDVDTLTKVGETIEVKYKNGYIKSICVEADSKMAMIQDVIRRI